MATPAETEFEEKEVEEKVVQDGVTKEELEAATRPLTEQLKGLEGLRNDAEIIRKLKEVFGGEASDPRDAMLRKEIKRLVPELDDLDKIKSLLPTMVDTLEASAEERLQVRTNDAQDIMKGLMPDIGLDPKDAEASGYLEEVLAREIRTNSELMRAWARGNIKFAVNKAFEKIQTKLVAPIRANTKKAAVRTITESPKAAPKGGPEAGKSKEADKVDFGDTSRAGVQKIHDKAWEKLQSLMSE